MSRLRMDAPPAPVAIAELKAFLRIAHSEEDALLAAMLRSAGSMCEAFTGRMLVDRAVEEALPASPAWTRLLGGPVRAIEAVSALGEDGSAAALPASDYALDVDAAGDGWVRVLAAGGAKRVRVDYRAGLAADANGVPEALRQGVVRLAAHLYARRGGGEESVPPPAAVTALWRPWRRLRLG